MPSLKTRNTICIFLGEDPFSSTFKTSSLYWLRCVLTSPQTASHVESWLDWTESTTFKPSENAPPSRASPRGDLAMIGLFLKSTVYEIFPPWFAVRTTMWLSGEEISSPTTGLQLIVTANTAASSCLIMGFRVGEKRLRFYTCRLKCPVTGNDLFSRRYARSIRSARRCRLRPMFVGDTAPECVEIPARHVQWCSSRREHPLLPWQKMSLGCTPRAATLRCSRSIRQ